MDIALNLNGERSKTKGSKLWRSDIHYLNSTTLAPQDLEKPSSSLPYHTFSLTPRPPVLPYVPLVSFSHSTFRKALPFFHLVLIVLSSCTPHPQGLPPEEDAFSDPLYLESLTSPVKMKLSPARGFTAVITAHPVIPLGLSTKTTPALPAIEPLPGRS